MKINIPEDSLAAEAVLTVNGIAVREFGIAQNGNEARCYVLVSEGDVIRARSTTTLAPHAQGFTDLVVDGILRTTSPIKTGGRTNGKYKVTFGKALFYRFEAEKRKGLKLARMKIRTRNLGQDPAVTPGKSPSAVSTIELQHWLKYPDQPSRSTTTATDTSPSIYNRAPSFDQYPRWSDLNLHIPTGEPSTFDVGFVDSNARPSKSHRDRFFEERLGFRLSTTCTFRLASSSDLNKLGFTEIRTHQSLAAAPGLNRQQSMLFDPPAPEHPLHALEDETECESASDIDILPSNLDTPRNGKFGGGIQKHSKLLYSPTTEVPLLGSLPPHPLDVGDQAAPAEGPSVQSSTALTAIGMMPLVLPGTESVPKQVLRTSNWGPLSPQVSSREHQPSKQDPGSVDFPKNRTDNPKVFSLSSQPSPAAPGVRYGIPDTLQRHLNLNPKYNQCVGLGLNQACFKVGERRPSNKVAYERCLAIIQQASHKRSSQFTGSRREAQPLASAIGKPYSPRSEFFKWPPDFVPSLVANRAVLPNSIGEKRKADYVSNIETNALEVNESRKSPFGASFRTREEVQSRVQAAHHRIAIARQENERLQEEEKLILHVYLLEQEAKQLENENANRQVKIDAIYGHSST